MKKSVSFFCVIAIMLFLAACNYFNTYKDPQGQKILARVHNDFLYLADVENMIAGKSPEDSAKIVAAYAESWVKKKLLLEKAQEYISSDDAGITRKVEEYRESLILYEYEKELIREKVNKSINQIEIREFYEKNKNNFVLENDVYKVKYIVIDPESEEFDRIKKLATKGKTDEDFEALEGYCKVFASSYNIDEGSWKTTEALKLDLIYDTEKANALATSNSYKEYKSGSLVYFVKIAEVLHQGEATPLDFVQNQVREMLFNKKKTALIENIYNKIYQDGIADKEVEIFAK